MRVPPWREREFWVDAGCVALKVLVKIIDFFMGS